MEELVKYPRTRHLEGSRLQPGDEDLEQVPWASLAYAKHTIFYDRLPHYFLEFDLLDRERGEFLDTARRRAVLRGGPVVSVPVLRQGRGRSLPAPAEMVGRSLYKGSAWRQRLEAKAREQGLDPDRVAAQTDPSDEAEGLYVKVEEDGLVTDRLKWIRASFLTAVVDSDGHWLERPILANDLDDGVDIFEV